MLLVAALALGAGSPTPAGAPAAVGSAASPQGTAPGPAVAYHGPSVAFRLAGPRPIGADPTAPPPGWEAVARSSTSAPLTAAGSSPDCASGLPACAAHDEPGIAFYSTVAGSGGNVSWVVSLPVDRNATLNQSNLYSAAWIGLTLSDPQGWLGECFVEIQFYPDQSYYNPLPSHPARTVAGAWVGAVVGWQIDLGTGAEDACFYEPLYLSGTPGPTFLNMTQGDRINVTTTGWAGSAKGEQVTVKDVTNGQSSSVALYNATGGYPLDPVYATNSFQDALLWRSGGEYPIFFGFDVGRSENGAWPTNGSAGGCSPGILATPSDPSAPCPSYDPGAWANDTLTPWHIGTPQFFNAASRARPTQVAFSQTTGGITGVGAASGGQCSGRAGSAWCTVPWFSYSCSAGAYEFGATDYPGLTTDFGKYNEYNPTLEANAMGLGFYAPRNFSVPFCTSPSYTVTVHQRGVPTAAIFFLGQAISGESNVSGVVSGTYSANAINGPGTRFEYWDPVGNITVTNKGDPYTTVIVFGDGVLVGYFNNNPPNATRVVFNNAPGGSIGVDPALTFSGPRTGSGNSLGTFATGGHLTLFPGLYTITALPPRGYVFQSWTANDSGASVAAPTLPVTWLSVTSLARGVTVTAHYVKSTTRATATLVVVGNGTVKLGTFSVTGTGAGNATGATTLPVGAYALVATPGAAADSVAWTASASSVLANYSLSSTLTLEGSATLTAVFGEVGRVTIVDSPTSGGSVSLLTAAGTGPALANNSLVTLVAGAYTIEANLHTSNSFVGWNASGAVQLSGSATDPVTTVRVSGDGIVSAAFAKARGTFTVKLGSSPTTAGSLLWDGTTSYTNLTSNKLVASGEHVATAVAGPGWAFAGWNLSGKAVLVGATTSLAQLLNVTGGAQLQALFVPLVAPVTFVVVSSSATLSTATLMVNGVTLSTGETTWLGSGSYAIRLVGNATPIQAWTVTSNLTVVPSGGGAGNLTVAGSGTVYVLLTAGHGPGIVLPGTTPSRSGTAARSDPEALAARP